MTASAAPAALAKETTAQFSGCRWRIERGSSMAGICPLRVSRRIRVLNRTHRGKDRVKAKVPDKKQQYPATNTAPAQLDFLPACWIRCAHCPVKYLRKLPSLHTSHPGRGQGLDTPAAYSRCDL